MKVFLHNQEHCERRRKTSRVAPPSCFNVNDLNPLFITLSSPRLCSHDTVLSTFGKNEKASKWVLKEKKIACRAEAKTRQEARFGFRFWQREPKLRIFPRRRGQDADVACDYSEWHAALAKKGWDCCHGDTLWVAMATECNHGDSHGECDGRGLLFITSHPECNTGLGTLLRTHKGRQWGSWWRWWWRRWWRWW